MRKTDGNLRASNRKLRNLRGRVGIKISLSGRARTTDSLAMDRRVRAALAAVMASVVLASARAADPRLFRANDTLIGTRVPCSDEEKACFRYNRLLDPASGKCYRVGSVGPCLDAAFLLDRRQFEADGGRLAGKCGDPGKCPDHRFRMAFDGKCYSGKEVFGVFCDVTNGWSGWPYFFGGYECVCEGAECPPPKHVEQPAESGKCLFPNFRKDLTWNFFPRFPVRDLECSSAQGRCFQRGAVAFGSEGRCYKLLEQGPCPAGHHLVLDKQQVQQGRRISARCVPVERCPAGQKFMTHHSRCISEKDVKSVLCPDLSIFTDVYGETVCRFKEEFYEVVLNSLGEGRCELRYSVRLKGIQELPKPACSSSDPLDCVFSGKIDPDELMRSLGGM